MPVQSGWTEPVASARRRFQRFWPITNAEVESERLHAPQKFGNVLEGLEVMGNYHLLRHGSEIGLPPMTMTDSGPFRLPAFRGCVPAACPMVMSNLPIQRPVALPGALTPPSAVEATSRMSPADLPTGWGGAGLESGRGSAALGILAADWDLLFRAALEVLTRVAAEKPAPGDAHVRLQDPGTVLQECLAALDQLRVSATGAMAQLICQTPREFSSHGDCQSRPLGPGAADRLVDAHGLQEPPTAE